jgi:SAM-dependent methyltransferase
MHDDAEIYDTEVSGFRDDIPFWESVVDEIHPKRVLELACGTGRLLVPLAKRALQHQPRGHIVGLDISEPMLARAREAVASDAALGGSVELVAADMASFDFGSKFDLIVIAFNSFAFLVEQEGQIGCLERVRAHLAPGGVFGLDLIVPQVAWLAISEKTAPHRLEIDLTDPSPGVRRFLRFVTERYDPARQVEDDLYTYEIHMTGGEVVRRTSDLAWSMVFPQQLELLLKAARLRPVQRYGGYDRAPFTRRSRQYVWLSQAAD